MDWVGRRWREWHCDCVSGVQALDHMIVLAGVVLVGIVLAGSEHLAVQHYTWLHQLVDALDKR